ncbi:MAG: putative toxin-antitoxin system toxin component, PIN family [Acidobacteriota bacterium]
MRVVLDTNVFVSGVFFSGPPYEILKAWRDRKIILVFSPEILDEYRRTGEKLSRRYEGVDLDPFLALVVLNGKMFESAVLDEAVCEDPEDDKFFACALASHCTTIISGDKHLLKASGYRDIEVLKPRKFLGIHL